MRARSGAWLLEPPVHRAGISRFWAMLIALLLVHAARAVAFPIVGLVAKWPFQCFVRATVVKITLEYVSVRPSHLLNR